MALLIVAQTQYSYNRGAELKFHARSADLVAQSWNTLIVVLLIVAQTQYSYNRGADLVLL